MHDITIIEGADLALLCTMLGVPDADRPHRLRIWQAKDGSRAKVKVNEGTWSPPLGARDEEAR
jgi:hypothetical protein